MEIFIGILVIFIISIIWSVKNSSAQLEKAKKDYYTSLEKLKNDPSNADLKQHTLNLGRIYSNLTRDSKGVTTVDEVALLNDINAACAAASVNSVSISNTTQQTIEERLSTLSSLLEKGLISESEYDERKKEILSNI